MTNFERLTESPEILAGVMADIMFEAGCDRYCPADTGECDRTSCVSTWLAWLEKEAGK